ncbi:MAG: GNAT family N-acetyltransferase [Deltaproteobacteria bacterium]|nr:GNAT family N-acetyltransferase [Deltaproteobacteria bacterium]
MKGTALTTYRQWTNGPRAYHSEFQGKGVELLGYYLYASGDTPAGVAGIYRLEGEPDRVWMGWFGVKPEFRKSTLEKES